MSTFSGLTVPEVQKEDIRMVNGDVVKFKYPEVVVDLYIYREAVENNNSLRHDDRTKLQFGLESKWGTTWWPIQVLLFLIACAEVNTYLVMKYFLKTDYTFMDL